MTEVGRGQYRVIFAVSLVGVGLHLALPVLAAEVDAVRSQPATQPASNVSMAGDTVARAVLQAVAEGKITYRLTQPEQMVALIGQAVKRTQRKEGREEALCIEGSRIQAWFTRRLDPPGMFGLRNLQVDGNTVDIGENRLVVLRTQEDLKLVDSFYSLCNVSLAKLDLRGQEATLRSLAFDTRTVWPAKDRQPQGFDPARLMEEAKNPGLGVRTLQGQGIDGSGVHIAIIDQPLLRTHEQYVDRLERYEDQLNGTFEPQMHAPAVASIAVGKTCGVAPAARLTYISVPTWTRDNLPYCKALRRILEINREAKPADHIRIVSISTGMFESQPHVAEWRQVVQEATESGVLVITCETQPLCYGCLRRFPGRDPDDPGSYRPTHLAMALLSALLVPTERTVASPEGDEVYTYWPEGGLSWAAPYLAGLAALAYQVSPGLSPQQVMHLLAQTATRAQAGMIVNPRGFIEAARRLR